MSAEHEDLTRLREATEVLGEYFDSVQIFATRHEAGQEDGTVNVSYGSGNWFARYGQVKHWTIRREEEMRIEIQEEN